MNPKIDEGMPRISLALIVLFVLAMLMLLQSAHAQESDIFVSACATQDACTLQSNVPWSVGARTWRFTAKYPNESIRVWIRNQNTTSAHSSQTVSVFITDDKTATSLLTQADRWLQAQLTDNTVVGSQCVNIAANSPTSTPGANGKATCYVNGMYAVQVAVRITGAAGAAGSPDLFDIGIVQQQSTTASGPQPGSDDSSGGYQKGTQWTLTNAAAAGATAQVSKAAITGIRHIVTCVSFSAASTVAPGAASQPNISISSTTNGIMWQMQTAILAVAGQNIAPFQQCGLNLVSAPGDVVTAGFSANSTNTSQSINLQGYDTQ